MRAAKPAQKTCQMCGETFTRKRFNGRLEDYTVFSNRKHCSVTCANRASVKPAPKKVALLQRSYKYRKTVCEACGATTNLHGHHIDGNRFNVTSENVQTLCGSCHATHHNRARRAGQAVAGKMACREWPLVSRIGWTVCEAWATRSSRRSRSGLHGASSTPKKG